MSWSLWCNNNTAINFQMLTSCYSIVVVLPHVIRATADIFFHPDPLVLVDLGVEV